MQNKNKTYFILGFLWSELRKGEEDNKKHEDIMVNRENKVWRKW